MEGLNSGHDLGMTSQEEWRPTSQRGAPLEMWRKSEAVVVVEWRRSGEGLEGPDCPGHDFLLPAMTQLQSISLSTQSIHISNSPTRPFGLLITVWTRFPPAPPPVIHKSGLIQSVSRNFIYNTSQRVPVCLCGCLLVIVCEQSKIVREHSREC